MSLHSIFYMSAPSRRSPAKGLMALLDHLVSSKDDKPWKLIELGSSDGFLLRTVSHLFDEKVFNQLIIDGQVLSMRVRYLLFMLATALMLTALARPVIKKPDILVKKEGIAIVLGIDVSKSMQATDSFSSSTTAQ